MRGSAALSPDSALRANARASTDGTPVGDKPSGTGRLAQATRRQIVLFALFALELIALCLAHLPGSLTLDQFAFCDAGANLTVHYLTSIGLRPAVDFGFNYGLLSLVIAQPWFGVFGASPYSFQAMMLAANLLIAWALAEVATRLKLGAVGLALLFLALGIATQATYPAAAQAFEAALLALALAQQAAGRRDRALAFCTAAVLVKPSMGYFYGLVLIALLVHQTWREQWSLRKLMSVLLPAAITGITLAALLAVLYGPLALLRTALPINAAVTYSTLHFGFLRGIGSEFWRAPGMPWMFYLFDVSGFWICATIFLFAIAIPSTPGVWKGRWSARTEMILTCALLHAIFITLLFGNKWSWFYYSYLLIVGVAVATDLSATTRRVGLGLCVVLLFTWTGRAHMMTHIWRIWQPEAATAGLWAAPDEADEWQRVREIARGNDAVILDTKGAADLLFPEFARPVTLYLDPGWMLPSDIDRKMRQLEGAQMVILPYGIGPEVCRGIPDSTELRDSLNKFEPVFQGQYFEILRRRVSIGARYTLVR